jgi:allantoinase
MAEQPARLAGLNTKGRIRPGFDADFVVFSPDEEFVVDPAALHHRHPVTPYAGRVLSGVVRQTLLHGKPIDPEQPRGRLLSGRHISSRNFGQGGLAR